MLLEPLRAVLPRPGLVNVRVHGVHVAVQHEGPEGLSGQAEAVVQQREPVRRLELHELVGAPVELLEVGQGDLVPGLVDCAAMCIKECMMAGM